jgi:hypothetical protein
MLSRKYDTPSGASFSGSTPILRQLPAGGTGGQKCGAGPENILQQGDWRVAREVRFWPVAPVPRARRGRKGDQRREPTLGGHPLLPRIPSPQRAHRSPRAQFQEVAVFLKSELLLINYRSLPQFHFDGNDYSEFLRRNCCYVPPLNRLSLLRNPRVRQDLAWNILR